MDARHAIIKPYIRNKVVLDLGVGDIQDRFLHEYITREAKETTGIEIDPKRAKVLQKMGYQISVADVCNFNLNKKFDVVVAGDLIEHLTNFNGFIESVHQHLKEDGFFILNTPNLHSINILLRGLLGRIKLSSEHTCGFNGQLLRQLLGKYTDYFELQKLVYYNHPLKNLRNRLIQFLSLGMPLWKEHILIICQKRVVA